MIDSNFEAWERYLDSLSQDELVGPKLAEHVRWWWNTLSISNCLPVPCAGLTADEERFQFAWSYPHLLLEVDVGRNGAIEWFARDRVSGEAEDGILTQGAGPTVEFTRWSLLLAVEHPTVSAQRDQNPGYSAGLETAKKQYKERPQAEIVRLMKATEGDSIL